MIIKNIKIKNFRCFKCYEVDFAQNITVLIGKNGTGKTNLITALKKGASFMFSKYKFKNMEPFSSGDLHVAKLRPMDANFDDDIRDFVYPIELAFDADFYGKPISWALVKQTQRGVLSTTKYKDAFEEFIKHFNTNRKNGELPVIAFFSDSYPHEKINVGSYAKSVLNKAGSLPRSFGYYQWDANTNCAEIWQERYIKIYNAVNDYKNSADAVSDQIGFLQGMISGSNEEQDKFRIIEWENRIERLTEELRNLNSKPVKNELTEELNFIDNFIISFTQPLRSDLDFINKEFEVRKIIVNRPKGNDYNIQFAFASGKTMFFNTLPQGYNRLLSIVFDIAYRSFCINGIAEPQGIVFIDEVELHLHPALAQEVIERLHKTFPKIQFIVSTHSPLVISNLKADGTYNKIIKLENDGVNYSNENVDNIYGIDYTTSLTEIMDANFRIPTIDKFINAFLVLSGKKKTTEAGAVLKKLTEYLGGDISKLLQDEINEKLKAYE